MSSAWRFSLCLMFAFLLVSMAVSQDAATAPIGSTQVSNTQGSMPHLVKFSGTLAQTQGVTAVTFALYKDQHGGAPVWMETQNVNVDAQGRFTIYLGAASGNGLPPELFATGEARWVGVRTTDGIEQDRVLLVSVPYAMKAQEAETLNGLTAAEIALQAASLSTGTVKPATLPDSAPSATPGAPATVTATSYTASNFADSTTDQVVNVTQSGTGAALKATTGSSTTNALFGINTSTSGIVRGVYGESNSTATNSAGVYGVARAGTGVIYGVLGMTSSTQGTGAQGTATAATGNTIGLRGQANSTSGMALQGASTATSGSTQGLNAFVMSPAGTAAVFDNRAGGKILSLRSSFIERLSVDGSGNITTSGVVQSTGAGFKFPDGTTQTKAVDDTKVAYLAAPANTFTGGITAASFSGDGSALTNIKADTVTNGVYSTGSYVNPTWLASLDGAKISGTLASSALGGNYTAVLSFSNPANAFTGNGAGLTNLTASNLASGTVPSAVLSGTYSAPLNFANANNTFVGKSLSIGGSGNAAISGSTSDATGTGVDGRAGGTGVYGQGLYGVYGRSNSAGGSAGVFDTTAGGQIIAGRNNGVTKFAVDANGNVTGTSFIGSGAALTGVIATSIAPGDYSNAVNFTNHTNAYTGASVVANNNAGTAVYATGTVSGVFGLTHQAGGIGVSGAGDGTNGYGMVGTGSYTGAYGSGNSYGVYGLSTAGDGVFGKSYNGYGVHAEGVTAVYGTTTTAGGTGVVGSALAGTGVTARGVYGYADSGAGVSGFSTSGVAGYFSSASGTTLRADNTSSPRGSHQAIQGRDDYGIGVLGASNGSFGCMGVAGIIGAADEYHCAAVLAGSSFDGAPGVWAYNTSSAGDAGYFKAAFNYGVRAETAGTGASAGLYGLSTGVNGNGVIGESSNGSSAYGVWGKSTSGYAGYFSGNVNVVGTLTASNKQFKIDHPQDPANKYLYHTSVESPDMKNIYDGVSVLDAKGEAWVTLPDWFEALNRDFRYQLTPIGAPFTPYIAEEIANNQFKIAGGLPGKKVSWQVTGIRQDAWANAHRSPVEVDKPEAERGSYLHPELFNQPAEKSVEQTLKPQPKVELTSVQAAPGLRKR